MSAETGVGQPDVEGQLGGLSHRPGEQQQRHHGGRPVRQPVRGAEDVAEIERPEPVPDEDDPDEETRVPDPGGDEGLLGGVGGDLPFEPEPDQQIGAEAHALPAHVEQQVVVGQDQDQHEEDEQVHVSEEAAVAGIVPHVVDGVDVDQRPHPGHGKGHDRRQRIDPERHAHVEVAGGDPVEQRGMGPGISQADRLRRQIREHGHGHAEGCGHRRRPQPPRGRALPPPAGEQQDRRAGQGKGKDHRCEAHSVTPSAGWRRRRQRSAACDTATR